MDTPSGQHAACAVQALALPGVCLSEPMQCEASKVGKWLASIADSDRT